MRILLISPDNPGFLSPGLAEIKSLVGKEDSIEIVPLSQSGLFPPSETSDNDDEYDLAIVCWGGKDKRCREALDIMYSQGVRILALHPFDMEDM